jgi:hypothetical protein
MSKRNINSIMRAVISALLSAALVIAGTILYLGKDLSEFNVPSYKFPASEFAFTLGSGHPEAELAVIDNRANGYALLSSGPVRVQADNFRALRYNWRVAHRNKEAAFFWRQKNSINTVSRTEIRNSGNRILDLSTQANWYGEIVEFGFLVGDETIAIGPMALEPDSLQLRLQMMWQGWTTFEEWSQQSVHFLQGGDYDQIISLPPLVTAWLFLTIILTWLAFRLGGNDFSRVLVTSTVVFFLIAWMILDIRWTANNLKQVRLSLETQWQADEEQRSRIDLDGDLYQYVQQLKFSVLGAQNARILIIGEKDAAYYQLRAKYHLLPHSVHVASRFPNNLKPENLDFVMFFGEPSSIANVRGWNKSWQRSLTLADRGAWGAVYRVK